jgi:hypothetical protein
VELSRVGTTVGAAYSEDGRTFIGLGSPVTVKGLSASVFLGIPFSNISSDFGYADVDWIRIMKRVNPAPLATLTNKD